MLEHQREVLERFGVNFDVWFSEGSLHEEGAVQRVIEVLRELGHVYEKDGALWLRTTDFGDDKDRVLVRSNGEPTYLAPDIAYFMDKVRRGFTRLIYIWGADHHGHVPRMQAAIRALGEDPDHAEFIIGQLVSLTRGGVPVRMSKRTGELVTFDELLDEVGRDAARYLLVRQGADTPLDFDMEQAVAQSQDNPVFYVQYAHARIASIVRHAAEQGIALAPIEEVALEELQHESEQELLRKLAELPEVVEVAASLRAPHRLTRLRGGPRRRLPRVLPRLPGRFGGRRADAGPAAPLPGRADHPRRHIALARRVGAREDVTDAALPEGRSPGHRQAARRRPPRGRGLRPRRPRRRARDAVVRLRRGNLPRSLSRVPRGLRRTRRPHLLRSQGVHVAGRFPHGRRGRARHRRVHRRASSTPRSRRTCRPKT